MLKPLFLVMLAVGSMNCSLLFSEAKSNATDAGPPTWRQSNYVKGELAGEKQRFGVSVSLSGDGATLAIGSRPDSGPGVVDVYIREDGSWAHQQHLVDSAGISGDGFGTALSLSDDGNRLAIGAKDTIQGDKSVGAVFVFARTESTWTQSHVIMAPFPDTDDQFGGAVSLSGDGKTLGVGAEGEDGGLGDEANNTLLDSGAVYIYGEGFGEWIKLAYLKSSSPRENDGLGHSVSLNRAGDVLAASAILEDSTQSDSGGVFIFVRSEFEKTVTWSQHSILKANSPGKEDHFGESVSLSADGTRVAIGAKDEDGASAGINGDAEDNSASLAGATYIFAYDGMTTWKQEAYIKASNSDEYDWFGISVALNGPGNTLIVGANHEDSAAVGLDGISADNTHRKSGAAYVFVRTETTWSQEAYSKASNSDADDFFGTSVSIGRDTTTYVVGATGEASSSDGLNGDETDNSATKAGAAYIFERIEQ